MRSLRHLLERLSRLDDAEQGGEMERLMQMQRPGSLSSGPGIDTGVMPPLAAVGSATGVSQGGHLQASSAQGIHATSALSAAMRRRTGDGSSAMARHEAGSTSAAATQPMDPADAPPAPVSPLPGLLVRRAGVEGGASVDTGDAPAAGSGDSSRDATGDEDSADHFRLGNLDSWDMQAMATWLAQQGVFVLMLLLVFLINNYRGIIFVVWFVLTCHRADEVIKKQVALKGDTTTLTLLSTAAYLSVHAVSAAFILLGIEDVRSVAAILFIPSKPPSLGHAVYLSTIADNLIRLIGMLFKVNVLMVHPITPGKRFRQRGHVLTLIEYITFSWRWAAPSGIWYQYFIGCGINGIAASAIAGAYLSIKVNALADRLRLTSQALQQSLAREAVYGEYASREEVAECGTACAICQENMATPLRLPCRHIFCEDCVSEWFEREPTCPLCRAVVKPGGLRSYSNGGTSMWPQIF